MINALARMNGRADSGSWRWWAFWPAIAGSICFADFRRSARRGQPKSGRMCAFSAGFEKCLTAWRPDSRLAVILLALAFVLPAATAMAQEAESERLTAPIAAERSVQQDRAIDDRLRGIFREIDALQSVAVRTSEGVVQLSGSVANDAAAARALALAERIEGVVAVEDEITRTLSVEDNLNPLLERTEDTIDAAFKAWPLYAIALIAFVGLSLAAHFLASATSLWQAIAPNPFIAQLVAQSIRIVGVIAGLLLALSVLDAMALFGAAAGSAGLIGLAVGFAVKDTIENYVASVMLSLRQPFRADDHVVINEFEGIVVRLTSRATILMTLDGNHLRIPNADVFKGVILNYTLNPQRRLTFKLGVDAADDPIEASAAGLEAMGSLDFLLAQPKPTAVVEEVGDSNIVIEFAGWIDQREADFLKARSAAINVVKTVLENRGFTLPEPIYRVRLEGLPTEAAGELVPDKKKPAKTPAKTERPAAIAEDIDVALEDDVRRQVAEERAKGEQEDLLSEKRPME